MRWLRFSNPQPDLPLENMAGVPGRSGFFAHKGRPGKRGGSLPRGEGFTKAAATIKDVLGLASTPQYQPWGKQPVHQPKAPTEDDVPSLPHFDTPEPDLKAANEAAAAKFRQLALDDNLKALLATPRQKSKTLDTYVDRLIGAVEKWRKDNGFGKEAYQPAPRWKSAGAVIFNQNGEVLVRKVAGGFSGYNYSFGKGKIDEGETEEQAAHRENKEEMGAEGEIVGDLGTHAGGSSDTKFFLMKVKSADLTKTDNETEKVEWMSPIAASEKLNNPRDLRVLVRALVEMKKHGH